MRWEVMMVYVTDLILAYWRRMGFVDWVSNVEW